MKKDEKFIQGIVAALDVVSQWDYSKCFKEIVESASKEDVLQEIKKNGLPRTKEMADQEFKRSG